MAEAPTGEPNPGWVRLKTVWAGLVPLRGREVEGEAERRGVNTYSARMDYLDGVGIDESMSVRFEGLVFNIVAVLRDLSTRRTVDLTLQETKKGA